MRIAIRMDDIAPGMDMGRFGAFRDMLEERGIRPLIGIVPRVEDPKLMLEPPGEDFWELVRLLVRDRGWIPAMHGLTHVYSTGNGGLFPLNRQSEFAGLPAAEQRGMLRRGREILESRGITTDIFMAPSHSYDRQTLSALSETGFKAVTDGYGRRPYIRQGLVFYPISVDRRRSLRSAADGYTTFVVHTNTMSSADMDGYRRMLDRYGDRFISYDELMGVPAVKRGPAGSAWEYSLALAKRSAVGLRGRLRRGRT